MNRALVFFTYAEDDSANIAATAVTYGGRSLAKLSDRLVVAGSQRVYVSAWLLKQDAINTAANGNLNVTWNSTPDSAGYLSVFLANIHQTTPLFSHDSGGPPSDDNLRTSPRATQNGDIVLYGATASGTGDFSPNNCFTEALEITIHNADGTGGYKLATGADESASVNHNNLGIGAIYMVCLADDKYGGAGASAFLSAVGVAAFKPAEMRSETIGFPILALDFADPGSAPRIDSKNDGEPVVATTAAKNELLLLLAENLVERKPLIPIGDAFEVICNRVIASPDFVPFDKTLNTTAESTGKLGVSRRDAVTLTDVIRFIPGVRHSVLPKVHWPKDGPSTDVATLTLVNRAAGWPVTTSESTYRICRAI